MKFHFKKSDCRGHVLVLTLVIAGLLGIAVAAFLNLLTAQLNYTVRAQVWNDCMPVVESGIEEALAQMNYTMCSNLTGNGWAWDGAAGAFSKTRNFGDSYVVTQIFTNATPAPYIIAQGYVPAPVTVNSGKNLIAAAGPTPGLSYIWRKVKVTTRRDPALNKAMVVKLNVNFNGHSVTIDSYDSAVGNYNPGTARDKGDVTSNSDLQDCTGNAQIKGHITTGPKGTVTLGGSGSIGDVAWVNGGTKGIKPGWWRKDANVYIPDVQQPWTTGTFPAPTSQGSWDYMLNNGNYEVNGNFTLDGSKKMKVLGDAYLWVRGNVTINGEITMNGSGNKLTIYVGNTGAGNTKITITGDVKKNPPPSDLIIYGLPNCKSGDIDTGTDFSCVLYAPQANVELHGNMNFCGSITANSVEMKGNCGFHYDEALGRASIFRGYIVTSWQEL